MLMPGAAVGDGEGYCLDPPQPGAQAAKWTGCWHPGPWSQVSPGALGALRCIGGKVRCTPCDLYASPTETIPPPPLLSPRAALPGHRPPNLSCTLGSISPQNPG